MNLLRIVLAGLGGFIAYFVVGGLSFVLFPSLKTEFLKYPAVYRSRQGQVSHLPAGMAAMLVSIVALAVIYARMYPGISGIAAAARSGAMFGVLIGVFVTGAFVLHNYVNLNIGLKLSVQQAVAYFVEWIVTCTVIGLIYRPLAPH
jgi:hypothetical protein